MAEMTAAEALGVLGGSEKQPQSEQELITSIIAGMTRGEKCFVLLWDSERVQIAALIEQQAVEIERLRLYRGCLDCRFNDSGIINNYLCHGKNCVDFDKWLEKEAQGESNDVQA